MRALLACFTAALLGFASLPASWGRAQFSQDWEPPKDDGRQPSAAPTRGEFFTDSTKERWYQRHFQHLISSALPEERRRLSSDAHLRPESEWARPNKYQHPEDIRIFIGIFSGATAPRTAAGSKYDYTARRNLIRATWMRAAQRYKHVEIKFIMGQISDPEKRALLAGGQREYGDFISLPEVDDKYLNLGNKTRYYFRNTYLAYPNVEYIVKIDDDVLILFSSTCYSGLQTPGGVEPAGHPAWHCRRFSGKATPTPTRQHELPILPERLLMVADQWSNMKADYIGCTIVTAPPITDPKHRWFQPFHSLVGKLYPLYFSGCVYVLSGRVVREVLLSNFDELRTSMEDLQTGWWMLASDAVYFEDRRLCRLTCDDATVGMFQENQQGFPMKFWEKVLRNPQCTRTPKFPMPYVPTNYRRKPDLEKMHELMV